MSGRYQTYCSYFDYADMPADIEQGIVPYTQGLDAVERMGTGFGHTGVHNSDSADSNVRDAPLPAVLLSELAQPVKRTHKNKCLRRPYD